MYQRNVDVDMLNAIKSMLADVSSISPSSELKLLPFFFTGYSLVWLYKNICFDCRNLLRLHGNPRDYAWGTEGLDAIITQVM